MLFFRVNRGDIDSEFGLKLPERFRVDGGESRGDKGDGGLTERLMFIGGDRGEVGESKINLTFFLSCSCVEESVSHFRKSSSAFIDTSNSIIGM